MKSIFFVCIICCIHFSVFAQDRLVKDLDLDTVVDTIYLDRDECTIISKLSSKEYRKIESKSIAILNNRSGITGAKDGFTFFNKWDRAGYTNTFKYNKESGKIQLTAMSRYEYGNVNNDGSGESTIDLITDKYIGKWNYYNSKNNTLDKISPIKTEMYLRAVSLEEFTDSVYFEYEKKCVEHYNTFKEIDIDSREQQLIDQKSAHLKADSYFEFKPETTSATINGFDLDDTYLVNSLKITTAYDRPADGETIDPYAEDGWGMRLLLLNNKDEILYKSFGVGDLYQFEPHFYKSDTSNKVIIVCQLGFEYTFGGEAFLYENKHITYIGNIDAESDSEEISLIDILEITEKNDQILFSLNTETVCTGIGSDYGFCLTDENLRYVYDQKLKLIRDF